MSWHKVSLSVDQVNSGEEMNIQDRFTALFMVAKGPKEMALFSTKLELQGLKMFFSPGSRPYAKGLIDQYNGEPCPTPPKEDVTLVSGHADAKDLLL